MLQAPRRRCQRELGSECSMGPNGSAPEKNREAVDTFFENPILNSPYELPKLHHALDKDGQPLDLPPVEGRRRSELITPVPRPRKRKNKPEQPGFVFGDHAGLS